MHQTLPIGGRRRAPHAHWGCAHNPIACIIPPHVFDRIVLNASKLPPAPTPALKRDPERARRAALKSSSLSQSLLSARIGFVESQRGRGPRDQIGGAGLLREFLAAGQKQRTIYTSKNTQRLPGTVVRREGDGPTNDQAVDEAYMYMGDTYDFYWEVLERDSVDDAGMPLNGSVHFDQDYDNAFWDGQRMVYGDGDQQVFDRFTKSVDVIGHEMTHGVTQYEAGLIYWGQTGALNESVSDVFGSMVKQWRNQETAAEADWLIGEGLFIPGAVKGVALRSLKAPGTAYRNDPVLGTDPQPSNMKDYQQTLQDNGGVHINSGIPNHAFYLAAVNLGGNSWETVGPVWYASLQSPFLSRSAKFKNFARITVMNAQQLLGPDGRDVVRQAWSEVGVSV